MPTVQLSKINCYYEVAGSGEPLLLIMGLSCSARQWQWLIPLLSKNYRVISFDNRDAGRSSKIDEEYTTEDIADDIAELLDILAIERTHVVSASFGGMIAQQFALRHPQRINKLVLGCTMPNFYELPPSKETIAAMSNSTATNLSPEQRANSMTNLFLSPSFQSENIELTEQLTALIAEEQAEQGADAFMRQLGAAMNHDCEGQLEKISAATLVLSGDQDLISPVANAHYLHEHIINSKLLLLPSVYHAWPIEHVELAAAGIHDFLQT
jgi:3-oxoadipate enol-lactonase